MRKSTGTILLFSLMCFVAIYSALSAVPVTGGTSHSSYYSYSGYPSYSNQSGNSSKFGNLGKTADSGETNNSGQAATSSQIAGQSDLPSGQALQAMQAGQAVQTTKAVHTAGKKALNDFIYKYFTDADGSIATNLRAYDGSTDTLSESVGLLLNNCILSDNKELFDKEVSFLKKELLNENYLVRWKTGKTQTVCNCAIDDLRIACALLDAYTLWGDSEYNNLAGFIQEAIYENQVSDYNLFELYDWKSGKARQMIPLCYFDLYTIDRAGKFNKGWYKVEDRGISVIKNGKIGDKSPFYYKYYDYGSGKYSLDEEYGKNKGICLTYTLYTGLHLSEVNEDTSGLTKWLKAEMKKGRLYAWYDPFTMKAADELESTAVYALAAVYANQVGESDLYNIITARMSAFQVNSLKSQYFGGFGEAKNSNFYSFDNLTAQWAFCLDSK